MTHKQLGILVIALTTLFSACKKDCSNTPTTYPDFSQLKVGNYWIYERFNVDTAGNMTTTGVFDSCYIEKDTQINNATFFKVIRPQPLGAYYNTTFMRDSLHYLINDVGQILFSSQNFTDTFRHYYITAGVGDTVCEIILKMADKDFSVSTTAGVFTTSSLKQTFRMYPNFSGAGNPRYTDTRYAENVGVVTETLPFYSSNPNYVQRRLVRYHLN